MRAIIVGLIGLLIFATSCAQEVIISPKNDNLVYLGRFNHQEKESKCVYSGSSVFMQFESGNVAVKLKEYGIGGDKNTNFIMPILDGDTLGSIKLKPGTHVYELSNNLPDGKHVIQLYKQTETTVGEVGFLGFVCDTDVEVFPYEKQQRNILAIGDSWTAAYGNAVAHKAPPEGQPNTGFHSRNQNHYESWPSIVSRDLKANLECIAISGRGMYRNSWNSTENTIPKVFDYYNPDKKLLKIDRSNFIPDVVIIHLGTNDFIAEWLGETASPLDSTNFVSTYISFVSKIRSDYPEAKIICLVGNSNNDLWPEELTQLTRFRNYITTVVDEKNLIGDKNVTFFELSPQIGPYGEEWHPTIRTHHQMADEIIPYLKQLMSW